MSILEGLQSNLLLEVADIGASVINEIPIYQPLLDKGLAHLNAFEGDERQIKAITNRYGNAVTIFDDFLYDGSRQTLHLASPASGMTSLLEPDRQALRFFNGFEAFGHIERKERIQTTKLDDIDALPLIDFLKMDIQGAELQVVKHGKGKLKECLAIQLEVSWICLYKNQPAFGEVDTYMRLLGYTPHCFVDVKSWSIAPTIFEGNFRIPGNQLLESDIVYIKDPLNLSCLSDAQLTKFALIAHHALESYDLCVFILLELEQRKRLPANSHQQYLGEL